MSEPSASLSCTEICTQKRARGCGPPQAVRLGQPRQSDSCVRNATFTLPAAFSQTLKGLTSLPAGQCIPMPFRHFHPAYFCSKTGQSSRPKRASSGGSLAPSGLGGASRDDGGDASLPWLGLSTSSYSSCGSDVWSLLSGGGDACAGPCPAWNSGVKAVAGGPSAMATCPR